MLATSARSAPARSPASLFRDILNRETQEYTPGEEYRGVVTGVNDKYRKYLTPVYGVCQYDLPARHVHQPQKA